MRTVKGLPVLGMTGVTSGATLMDFAQDRQKTSLGLAVELAGIMDQPVLDDFFHFRTDDNLMVTRLALYNPR